MLEVHGERRCNATSALTVSSDIELQGLVYSHGTGGKHRRNTNLLCHAESQVRNGYHWQDQDVDVGYKTKRCRGHTELEGPEVSRRSERVHPSVARRGYGDDYLCYAHGHIPCPDSCKTEVDTTAKPYQRPKQLEVHEEERSFDARPDDVWWSVRHEANLNKT
jgi:hypothetical protein